MILEFIDNIVYIIDEFSKTFDVEKTMIYDSQKAMFETFSNCVIISFKMIFI